MKLYSLVTLLSLLPGALPLASAEVLIHFGAIKKTLRVETAQITDPAVMLAALQGCDKIKYDLDIPEFFCLSQIRFREDGRTVKPNDWDRLIAHSLRNEMVESAWLLKRLETSSDALQSMTLKEFIERYLESTPSSSIIQSWLKSRAQELSGN